MNSKLFGLFLAAGLCACASAQVRINEILRDGPGGDQGQEFVELKGTPGASLDGYWFLVIEGDSVSKGLIDQAIPLNGQTIGSNGLFLIRDSVDVLNPAPASGTNVLVIDFAPDIENGAATYMLVRDYTGFVINANTNAGLNNVVGQTDIDSNDDGVAGDWGTVTATGPVTTPGGSQPWSSVVDAFGWLDIPTAGQTDANYGSQFGGVDFDLTIGRAPGNINFTSDGMVRIGNAIVASDIETGAFPGPYSFDADESEAIGGTVDFDWLATKTYTPGSENPQPTAVVYPSAVAIVEGQFLFGNIASLSASDNNRYAIISDENAPTANVEFTTTAPFATLSQLEFELETISVRDDQSQFFAAWDTVASAWVDLDFTVTTLTDQTRTGVVSANVARFLSSANEIRTRLLVVPSQDLEAGDGWSTSIDLHELTLTP